MAENIVTIYDWMKQTLGYTDAQAAGALGNLRWESRFNPGAVGGPAHGIVQWQDGRFSNLESFAQAQGTSWDNLNTQLLFMSSELAGPYSGVQSQMKAAKSPTQAATIWQSKYEISDPNVPGSGLSARIDAANTIYQYIKENKLADYPYDTPGPKVNPATPGPGTLGKPGSPGVITGFDMDQLIHDIQNSPFGALAGIFSPLGPAGSGIGDALKLLAAPLVLIAKLFSNILWLFNVDHFMKFMLYIIGFLAIATGLGMVTMGAGKPEEVAA